MATSYSDSSPTGAMEALDLDSSASAAGSGIFSGDMKKHDDLKTMLDSSKESHKLEAMKRIIGMIARGRDCSDLFPAVVKNVVSKNIEIKKLVYVYLTRYAEEQQDLALLSISTFQRALKVCVPNSNYSQLIKFLKNPGKKTREIKYINSTNFFLTKIHFFAISKIAKYQFLNWKKI